MSYSIFDLLNPPRKPRPKPKLKPKAEELPAKYPLDSPHWEVVYWHNDYSIGCSGKFHDLFYEYWMLTSISRYKEREAEQNGYVEFGDEDLGISLSLLWMDDLDDEADESNNKMPESLSHPETQ
jgi:hypothetical protein